MLQLLKSAQMQHGLRHGDYTRYRYLCRLFFPQFSSFYFRHTILLYYVRYDKFTLHYCFEINRNEFKYRRYCTARLRRLYKSLKFTHGRGKYTKRAITESTVTEVRCVLLFHQFVFGLCFIAMDIFHLAQKFASSAYNLVAYMFTVDN